MSTTAKKYEELTPMEKHRLLNSNERKFRALQRDHEARLNALYNQLPNCKTAAQHRQVMASIRELLSNPTGPSAA